MCAHLNKEKTEKLKKIVFEKRAECIKRGICLTPILMEMKRRWFKRQTIQMNTHPYSILTQFVRQHSIYLPLAVCLIEIEATYFNTELSKAIWKGGKERMKPFQGIRCCLLSALLIHLLYLSANTQYSIDCECTENKKSSVRTIFTAQSPPFALYRLAGTFFTIWLHHHLVSSII